MTRYKAEWDLVLPVSKFWPREGSGYELGTIHESFLLKPRESRGYRVSESQELRTRAHKRGFPSVSLNLLGAGPQAMAPKLITILDPVAGVRYMLDSENKLAHKMTLPPAGSAPDRALPKGGEVFFIRSAGGAAGQT